jgi:hypothetical protein
MTFQNNTRINSSLFFCRASADQYNFSSNPTFTSTCLFDKTLEYIVKDESPICIASNPNNLLTTIVWFVTSIEVISYLVPPDVIKRSPLDKVLEFSVSDKTSLYFNVFSLYFLTVLVVVTPFTVVCISSSNILKTPKDPVYLIVLKSKLFICSSTKY